MCAVRDPATARRTGGASGAGDESAEGRGEMVLTDIVISSKKNMWCHQSNRTQIELVMVCPCVPDGVRSIASPASSDIGHRANRARAHARVDVRACFFAGSEWPLACRSTATTPSLEERHREDIQQRLAK